MERRTQAQREAGFTLIEVLMVVLIISLLAALAIPALQRAMRTSERGALVADARALYDAFVRFNVDTGTFPSTSTPKERAFNRRTLFPLSANGYYNKVEALMRKLEGGQVAIYDSPNIAAADTQFFAVLVSAFDPSIVVLVAHTDQFDGAGNWYDGVYVVEGERIVRADQGS